MPASPVHGLYAITDPELISDADLVGACAAALRGGARLLQYRHKRASTEQRIEHCLALANLCREHGALLLVNDSAELAARVNAHGVHLGQGDGRVSEARSLLGDDAIIGVTCHNDLALARQAISEGADYVAFGRFFPSLTKPGAAPAELATLAASLPVAKVAIGGVTPDNAPQLLQAGADAIAVIHSLFSAPDIEQRARQFARLFAQS